MVELVTVPVELEEVRRHFALPSDGSVVTFLSEHRTLAKMLVESAPHLRDAFGAETIFALRAPIDEARLSHSLRRGPVAR
jgi:hypothetical protein